MSYKISLNKDYFKFSSAHFTIFDRDNSEPLHGHNYYVSVDFTFKELNELDMTAEFNSLKKIIKEACDDLDEKILLPKLSPYLRINESPLHKGHTDVDFSTKHYCFPDSDIKLLSVKNITSESLAHHLHSAIKYQLSDVLELAVSVSETSGQTASFIS